MMTRTLPHVAVLFALTAAAVSSVGGCTYNVRDCDRHSRPRDGGISGADCADDDDCLDDERCAPSTHTCRPISAHPGPDGSVPIPDASTPGPDASGTPRGCSSTSDCPIGTLCSAGVCRARDGLCEFNAQCGSGRVCADGRCVTACSGADASPCPTGQTCTDGRCQLPAPTEPCDCAAGETCLEGQCLLGCVEDAECGPGLYCDAFVCRVDDRRPPPFCTTDAQCAAGSVCHWGVCRIVCPSGTREECLRRDVALDICGADHICTNAHESLPACVVNVDCGPGRGCVDAMCR